GEYTLSWNGANSNYAWIEFYVQDDFEYVNSVREASIFDSFLRVRHADEPAPYVIEPQPPVGGLGTSGAAGQTERNHYTFPIVDMDVEDLQVDNRGDSEGTLVFNYVADGREESAGAVVGE